MLPLNTKSSVLVVEDSDEDFDTLLRAFKKLDLPVQIVRAMSGDECLALLQGDKENPALQPSLVLMDLNLPAIDGREALREIKQDPLLKLLPVVVLTTSSNPRDLKACYELGANAYHIKPLQYPEHISLLQTIFNYWLTQVLVPKTSLL